MKNLVYLIAAIAVISCSADSNNVAPAPQARIDDAVPAEIRLGVSETILLKSKSVNADNLAWDLGNGETSTDRDVTLQYKKAGTYTVTLKVTSEDGRESTATRTIKVADYIMRSVTLKDIQVNMFEGESPANVVFPHFSEMKLWIEVKLGEKEGDQYAYDTVTGDDAQPVIWKSPVVAFSAADPRSFEFSIPGIAAVPEAIEARLPGSWGYGINLYGQDDSGTYLLGSTKWSGSQAGIDYDPGSDKTKFTMHTSELLCAMDFHGDMVVPAQ